MGGSSAQTSGSPLVREVPRSSTPATHKGQSSSKLQTSQNEADHEEHEEEDHSLQEHLLGAAALAGVAAVVGFGVMWFKNRRR